MAMDMALAMAMALAMVMKMNKKWRPEILQEFWAIEIDVTGCCVKKFTRSWSEYNCKETGIEMGNCFKSEKDANDALRDIIIMLESKWDTGPVRIVD